MEGTSTNRDNGVGESQRASVEKRYKDSRDPLQLSNGDHPGMQLVATVLTVTNNFMSWSRAIRIALGAKVKLGFIDGSCKKPEPDSDEYDQWILVDCMLISWILNSISKDLVESFLYVQSARDLWLELVERFGESNGPLIYQVQRKISNLKQGSMAVDAYFTKLKTLWDELDCLKPMPQCTCVPQCHCEVSKLIGDMNVSNQLMQFLVGLDECYEHTKNQILILDPLPSVNKAYSMILRVERQKEVQLDVIEPIDSTAMLAKFSHYRGNKPVNSSLSRTEILSTPSKNMSKFGDKRHELESQSTLLHLQSQAETTPKAVCLVYSRRHDFYTFNFSGDDSKYNTEVPLVESHENCPHKDCRLYQQLTFADDKIHQCSLAVVGTQLYCIGGMKIRGLPRFPNDPSGLRADVYCVDLSNEKLEWEKCAPMRRPRIGHLTFVVKEKIYVFGGGSVGEEHYYGVTDFDFLFSYTPFAEMYDPKTNRWEDLPQPPFSVSEFDVFGVSMDGTILYGSERQLVIYDISNGSWTESTTDHNLILNSYRPPGNLVYAHKFLYWLSNDTGLLCAYSLDKSLLFKSDKPLDFVLNRYWGSTFLSHLGGNRFCLLYKGVPHPELPEFRRIHCLKFGVTLEESSRKMDIVIESCQSVIIDRHEDISAAVTIDERVIEGVEDVTPAVDGKQRIIEA